MDEEIKEGKEGIEGKEFKEVGEVIEGNGVGMDGRNLGCEGGFRYLVEES
ncbi:hypothetical protein [Staphylococcus warneri]|nr:hypothetical protein [Staphylococcus warneri]